MRQTHEWTPEELDFLTQWYVLRGSAFIRARYPHLSSDACRQMATRLNLREDLQETRSIREVAREAGVTPRAVQRWLSVRPWARKVCTGAGLALRIPAPVERLYLTDTRRAVRPRGWLTTQQASARLNVSAHTVTRHCHAGSLTCVLVRGALYVDPHTLPHPMSTTPAPGHVTLPALATATGLHPQVIARKVTTTGVVKTGRRPAKVTSSDHARSFLSARGYALDLIETIIRRAQQVDALPLEI